MSSKANPIRLLTVLTRQQHNVLLECCLKLMPFIIPCARGLIMYQRESERCLTGRDGKWSLTECACASVRVL